MNIWKERQKHRKTNMEYYVSLCTFKMFMLRNKTNNVTIPTESHTVKIYEKRSTVCTNVLLYLLQDKLDVNGIPLF